MDDEEYREKYISLRILKSAQEYLKSENSSESSVYPIQVPDDLLYQVLKLYGVEKTDKLIHHIFKLGLTEWSERHYKDVFGTEGSLKAFIELVRKRNRD
jgi:hypothetical protein